MAADKRIDIIFNEVDSEYIKEMENQKELLSDIMLEQMETM